ncbi:MAG: 4-hydroxy-tetrahydrodipicolinate reductase [Velocimicrobium sp.]
MTKIIMHGCNGAMGRTITNIVKEEPGVQIVAGVDINTSQSNDYPVYDSICNCKIAADVIIDFASSKAISDLLSYAVNKKTPVVLCTTGLSDEQVKEVEQASKQVAILRSANMSLGVNMLLKLVKEAIKTLEPAGFDVEIVEKHHSKKVDAPSGTALAFADSMNEAMNQQYEYVYDRSKDRKQRNKKELGISAVRGGTIVGEHEIIFAGIDEVIEFKHTAYSKAIFAKGSVSAAKYLAGRRAGLYDMSDVING